MPDHFRRTDPRYARRLDIEITAGNDRLTATTGNISLGGLFVETLRPFALQTRLHIRFRIPTQPEPVEATGEVRWIEPGGPGQPAGMGVRFQGLRAREVWALNRFFQSSI
ncbi:MAG: TIGR02266 family protein [Polyangia bacterium]